MIASAVPHPFRWPNVFLGVLLSLIVVAFATDRIHAQDASEDIIIVPAAVSLELLQEAEPAPGLPALAPLPATPSHATPAVTVEVVKPTWWDQLWAIILPLLGLGGTYAGIWLVIQTKALVAANAARVNERKDEAAVAKDTNEKVNEIAGGGK